jgi:2-keto-3-deoxy-L-rhamnonate aldolase RhmA/NAD(P)-dependent dehydrogenase (short-subunit alcohol dehydrogenase family)
LSGKGPLASSLRERIRSGDCIGCIWLALGSAAAAELAADSEPDAVVFDLQHGLWERQALEGAIGMVRAKAAPLVRVARNGAAEIGTALDAGAMGVIVPLVETAAEARQAVDAARYPPEGHRSGGGVRPLMDFKRYVPAANQHVLVAVMIETKRGVENAAAIASTPGVDMVFIGTGDLALSLGVFPDLGPRHEAAIAAVQAACRKAGTACGVFTLYSTMASDRRRQGFQCVVLGDDTTLMHQAFKQTSARFRARTAVATDPLSGAVALVTGTSRGIGPCLVRALLEVGAKRVYCAARDPTQTAALLASAPDRLLAMKLDVTSDTDAETAAKRAGDVTLLINNAGFNFNQAFSSADAMANARMEMETNYFGPLRLCRAFAPVLRRNGGGIIVNMLSILAHMNLPMMGSLCASKAAALSLTQALRAELKSQGTRVVGVLPGAVDTDMTRGLAIPKLAPRDVATAVVDGLRRGLEEIYPGDMAAGVAFGLALDPKEVERQFAQYLPPGTR